MKKFLIAMCVTLSIAAPAQAQYVADYDTANNTLALPWLKVGADYYSNVVLSVPPGQPWSLQHFGAKMATAPLVSAVYDASTSMLSIPAVSLRSTDSSRAQVRMGTRSTATTASDDLTLVGGVEVSLADGQWQVARTGTSVRITSTSSVPVITGTIVDRFKVTCTATAGTTLCKNIGFNANETFGLDTSSPTDGTTDQVWKVASGSQCLTIQNSGVVWDTSVVPAAGALFGDDASEKVQVSIYPYPDGDGLYLMSYGNGSVSLSCSVFPVSGVTSVVQNTSSDLTVSSTSLTGEVGSTLNFYILGGTPPYTVISENNALASVSFGAASTNKGQLVSVTLNSTGLSNADTAATQIFVFDWFQRNVSIPVSITNVSGGSGGGTLSIYPASVTNFSVGSRFLVRMLNGTPPYNFFNGLPNYIQVTPVAGTNDTFEVYLFGMLPGGGSLSAGVMFFDSTGLYTNLSIDTPASVTELKLSSNDIYLYPEMWMYVGIEGGFPPFTPINPNPEWFDVKLSSERVFKVKLRREATVPGNGLCAALNFTTYLPVMDSTGSVTNLKINPILQCGSVYIGYN